MNNQIGKSLHLLTQNAKRRVQVFHSSTHELLIDVYFSDEKAADEYFDLCYKAGYAVKMLKPIGPMNSKPENN